MRMRFAFAVILFFALLGNSSAQTNPLPDTAAKIDFSKEAWLVERMDTTISVDESGRDVREVTAEIRVSAEAGVKQFAVLNFTYTSANQAVEVVYIRVRKPDGSVVTTPDYNIQDMPAEITRTAPLYSDIHEKHVAVKALGVGDTLEYRIRYTTHTPQVPEHFWYEYEMEKDQIVREETLELRVPADKRITVKSPAFKPEVVEQGKERIYRWKHSNLQRKEEDEFFAKRTTPPPDIQISTFATWEEIGRWYAELVKQQTAVTPSIAKKAEELTRGLKTDDEKLRAIYSFVSLRVHYVGLDFGIGRYQPHAAEDVLDNQYGDCKDKHTLLAALLKAAGIDAWPALIHSSRKLDSEIPSLAQFNHVITVVPRAGGLVWLDTTTEVASYGLLLAPLRDKQALVVPTGKDPILQSTPAEAPFSQEQVFIGTGKLGSDGVLKGHITQHYHGDVEMIMRAVLRRIPEAKWNDAVQRLSRAGGFGGDVSNIVISPLEDLTKPLQISYDYVRKDYSDWEHKQILALLPPMGFESEGFKTKAPKESVFLGGVGEIVHTSEIELPTGSSLKPPKDLHFVEPYAEYHTHSVLQDGKLRTTRRLTIKKPEIPVAEWEGFQKMAKAASEDMYTYLPLQGVKESANNRSDSKLKVSADAIELWRKGQEARRNKNYEQAIDLLKKALEADPNVYWGWGELGLSYLEAGQTKLAIAALQKQIEIDPKDHYAYNNLGRAYLRTRENDLATAAFKKQIEINPNDEFAYNNLGLIHAREQKYGEAIKYFKEQIRISPSDKYAHANLANAYLEQKRYEEAVTEFQTALSITPKNADLQVRLGRAYLGLGQERDAMAAFNKAVDISPTPLVWNNIAYYLSLNKVHLDLARRYAESAVVTTAASLRNLSLDSLNNSGIGLTSALASYWDTLGWVAFVEGNLDQAERYLSTAWQLSQRSEVGDHLAQLYELRGKKDQAALFYALAMNATRPEAGTRERLLAVVGGDSEANALIEKSKGELDAQRTIKLPNKAHLDGKAAVFLLLENKSNAEASISDVRFLNGDEKLKSLSEEFRACGYSQQLPDQNATRILRRGNLTCTRDAGECTLILELPEDVITVD